MDRGASTKLARDDDGFSIIESMVALAMLAVIFTLGAAVLASSLNSLSRARVEAMASNLGQALIEEVRLVDYDDVGTTAGVPLGVFPSTDTVSIDGRDFTVNYSVTYEGSATGLDVIDPGGATPSGDGTPLSYDSGIDYKRVEITVTDDNGRLLSPTVFETIVAPPDIAANEGLSNVRVQLVKSAILASDTTPLPQVCLTDGTDTFTATPDAVGESVFIGVDPNNDDAAFPDYWYTARIGAACDTVDALSGWMIVPADLTSGADRAHVAPTATATISLTLTKAEQLTVNVFDDTATPIDAVLEVDDGAATYPVTVTGGTVDINTLDAGVPLTAGEYSITASAPGKESQTQQVEVGTVASVDFTLAEATTVPYELVLTLRDGQPAPWVEVRFLGTGIDLFGTADGEGKLDIDLPVTTDPVQMIVDPTNGLVPQTFTELVEDLPTALTLEPPAGWGHWTLYNIDDKGDLEWRTYVSGEPDTLVIDPKPDAFGHHTWVAPPYVSQRVEWWCNEVRVGGPVANYVSLGEWRYSDAAGVSSCP